MGPSENSKTQYAAFISYAHADEAMAARLHKALEIYPVPKYLRAQGKTTKPVFRDVAELTAAHSLSEKIKEAVKGSRVLIVLCSPAARASHWVNEEIRLFRELHGDAAILSAIIEGTPETAFPVALTEGGREPLAAALGIDKAGFKLGVTQLAAGMLGTGLDDLIQRGAKRRNRILGAGLAASLLFSGAMGFTAYQAVDARNEAQLERLEAEALLEFMVKDLKVKLEPAGSLELLEGVGRRAIAYYDKKEFGELSDDSLRLLAAARQVLAQVALDAGRREEAKKEIEIAAALTREVLVRNPDNSNAIYAHSQSEFWLGNYYFEQNKFDDAELYWQEYNSLSQRLYHIDPNNFDYIMEAAYSANNLGAILIQKNSYEEAISYLNRALEYFDLAKNRNLRSELVSYEIANTLGFISAASERKGSAQRALSARHQQVKYFASHKNLDQDFDAKYRYVEAKFLQVRLSSIIARHRNLKMDFIAVISDLEALTTHDPNNVLWQRTLLRAYIDYYFYMNDTIIRDKVRVKLSKAKMLLLSRLEDKNILEIFYAELIEGQDVVVLHEYWKSVFPKNSEENWYTYVELMELANKQNLKTKSHIWAREVTQFYSGGFDQIEPRNIQRLVRAHLILGECEAALSKAEALKKRGYKAPDVTEC